ncbi:MAG: bifunctional glutamate N-acetyltransferase/amino-acid acetyltransferase ArgJ [Candidatus Nanopelagicales bacterium]|nr:bifunctional glutamate N-acetyltransferase/amino-acid acetyltransferase ArgJ [Candidatus Nanopelagicales bacterium]
MSTTSAKGFLASGISAGLKSKGGKDVSLIVNQGPNYDAAAVFTSNKVKAAPVIWTQEIIKNKKLKAVILNSGGANACTGPGGFEDTHKTAEHLAKILSVGPIEIAVCSTGLIGTRLDMPKLLTGIDQAHKNLNQDGGIEAAQAIMTTDSHHKVSEIISDGWIIGAMIKGAGMLAPDMATMLCVITTDADISHLDHQKILQDATDLTLNRVDSDGCTSTNDTVILMSSGASAIKPNEHEFSISLKKLMSNLSLQLVNDAEGATKVITIEVNNAKSDADAVKVARAIARNNLLKCAMFGQDPNWGRILAAVGTADAYLESDLIDVYLNSIQVCSKGAALADQKTVALKDRDVSIKIDLNVGTNSATIYTNDLSTQYVHENSAYST